VSGVKAASVGRVELEQPAPSEPRGFEFSASALLSGHNLVELMSKSPWEVHWAEIRIS
jgi:hypothetical protein